MSQGKGQAADMDVNASRDLGGRGFTSMGLCFQV